MKLFSGSIDDHFVYFPLGLGFFVTVITSWSSIVTKHLLKSSSHDMCLLFSVILYYTYMYFLISGYLVGEDNTVFPDGRWWRFLYCSVLNVLNLVVCLIGANMFAKTSVAILAVVCVCLLSTVISFFVTGFKEVRVLT